MLRNTLSKLVFAIALFLLITLTPFLLQAELEQGVKIRLSHCNSSIIMFIFQAETGSTINLYLAGPDGQIQQLTHSDFAHNPSLSPDGKTVFFEDATDSKIGATISKSSNWIWIVKRSPRSQTVQPLTAPQYVPRMENIWPSVPRSGSRPKH